MKVSLNTIKQYIDFELPPVDELVKRINEQLGGVEEVIDLANRYNKIIIVKVVLAEPLKNSDHLNICRIDDGGVTENVERGEDGLVQVLTGASNIHTGMWAVWLPPSSTVPASYNEKELFVLQSRPLRGEMSHGMLASAKELAIGDSHEGLLEIDPNEWKPSKAEIKPGASFAKVYGLDDTIIEIENKMFTHRPDLFGQLGVAREIAGILGHAFKSPSWYLDVPKFENASGLELDVFNEAGQKVPRFMAVALKDVTVKPSPLWLQVELARLGSKAINTIVDVTNYVMLLTAQPVHAYDYDKIRGRKLGARMAEDGEEALLLNGKTYKFTKDDIVIADGEGVIGLAGIMGGGNSEVSADTKNVVLEVANFDMYAVRKSSMRHGIFTDALTRFNKGQSPLQNDYVLNLLMMSIKDVSSAGQATKVFDLKDIKADDYPIVMTTHFINDRLGLALSLDEMENLLRNVELSVSDEDGSSHPHPNEKDYPVVIVFPPFWRTDLELPEDIVEEVGRLYGFDKLPRELPIRSIRPAPKNVQRELKRRIREQLSRAGANEVLTYSFVHEKLIKNANQNTEKAYRLSNALSPDLQYYRLSVLPSLLDKVHMNSKSGIHEFMLFEIGKAHHNGEQDKDGLPCEFDRLAGVYANKSKPEGAPYFQVKRIVEQLIDNKIMRLQPLGEFDFSDDDVVRQLAAPFEPKRSALVWSGEKIGGVIGELKQSVQKAFKLPENVAAFELLLPIVEELSKTGQYTPLSRYPSLTQDISLKVADSVSYDSLKKAVREGLEENSNGISADISPVVIYQPANDPSTKTITFRIKATSFERTLREEEVTSLVNGAVKTAAKRLGAELA